MNRSFCLLAASLVVLGGSAAARAASRDEQTHACRGDAIHFCAGEIPNEEKITACMKRHIDELSPACRAMFKNGKNGKNGGNNGTSNGGKNGGP
ncbi:hypothetical protein CI15_10565 [Paraburkholderia monticola]|uniref:3',5'-cyclic-nucleotide phosphodiesterase n=1 Tax=Paraburkholderia monticola TaxID=1399968 RepID=A0A149PUQ9_9BURK|nr:hypothetical protein [Paraburkholderia monticola]KXU88739.1 hypothetical protein CI15_10565 [Paraburkholderia monticola]